MKKVICDICEKESEEYSNISIPNGWYDLKIAVGARTKYLHACENCAKKLGMEELEKQSSEE